jgi:hypothetical protein
LASFVLSFLPKHSPLFDHFTDKHIESSDDDSATSDSVSVAEGDKEPEPEGLMNCFEEFKSVLVLKALELLQEPAFD